jgi:hypothetical protein
MAIGRLPIVIPVDMPFEQIVPRDRTEVVLIGQVGFVDDEWWSAVRVVVVVIVVVAVMSI